MNEISLTNKEIVEGGMLDSAVRLLNNKLSVQTRLPLEDFVEYAQKRAKRFWENLQLISKKYNIPDGTKVESITGEPKKEFDDLLNYSGRIIMDPIPRPTEAVEGSFEIILSKLFVKRESSIKEIEDTKSEEVKV